MVRSELQQYNDYFGWKPLKYNKNKVKDIQVFYL